MSTSPYSSNDHNHTGKKESPRTERETHHDIRTRQLRAAEIVPAVGGRGELGFEEIPLGFQVGEEEFGFDGAGDEEGERAEEEGGGGFDV